MSLKPRSMRHLVYLFLLLLLTALISGGTYFWYTFMSPYGYAPSQPVVIDSRLERQDVFVYGTLRQPWLRWVIMGSPLETRPAVLPGYRKQELDIVPADSASTSGEVLTVTPEALKALDRYERVGVRYHRDNVKLADGSIVWVYRRISE
ncbi:gamma-glutamylcyclotransferase family protein [Salinicola avicenniae]|uniref:gamma-glutamylcyclotransferase family protein n=1 Tax=Salinicola avicenniae TaxID=2916836 RepID=UPI0020746350|nr:MULTISPECIES: gamma-glutamylcyclotransferase family protein [unclassified Salinicola]